MIKTTSDKNEIATDLGLLMLTKSEEDKILKKLFIWEPEGIDECISLLYDLKKELATKMSLSLTRKYYE